MGVVNSHLFGEDFTFGHPLLEFEKTHRKTYIKKKNHTKSSNNALAVPKCLSNAGLRTFHESATRLCWESSRRQA